MMEYGNTSAIPILLSRVDQGPIKLDGSQIILLSGFGGGLTWGPLHNLVKHVETHFKIFIIFKEANHGSGRKSTRNYQVEELVKNHQK